MCVSYDTLFGVLSGRQTFPLKWAFEGGLDDMSVQRSVSERFVIQAYAQINPHPTNQRGNDPLVCGHDGSCSPSCVSSRIAWTLRSFSAISWSISRSGRAAP